jgi:replicative DNA helicase
MRNDKIQRRTDFSTLLYGKIPPQAPEFEEAVLGAIMLERDTLSTVVEILPHEEVFYMDAHQKIYSAILSLNHAGYVIDLLTVTEELRKTGDLETVGGTHFVTKLTMSVMSSAHIETHARIIYEKYMQRELIRISGSVISDAYENGTDVFELLDQAQNELQVVADVPGAKKSIHISTSAAGVMSDIYQNREAEGHITGVPTGYSSMDEKMYGWQNTDLTILAARPSVGKTAFALNLAFNAVMSPI